jgi:hypothetical protein
MREHVTRARLLRPDQQRRHRLTGTDLNPERLRVGCFHLI